MILEISDGKAGMKVPVARRGRQEEDREGQAEQVAPQGDERAPEGEALGAARRLGGKAKKVKVG